MTKISRKRWDVVNDESAGVVRGWERRILVAGSQRWSPDPGAQPLAPARFVSAEEPHSLSPLQRLKEAWSPRPGHFGPQWGDLEGNTSKLPPGCPRL